MLCSWSEAARCDASGRDNGRLVLRQVLWTVAIGNWQAREGREGVGALEGRLYDDLRLVLGRGHGSAGDGEGLRVTWRLWARLDVRLGLVGLLVLGLRLGCWRRIAGIFLRWCHRMLLVLRLRVVVVVVVLLLLVVTRPVRAGEGGTSPGLELVLLPFLLVVSVQQIAASCNEFEPAEDHLVRMTSFTDACPIVRDEGEMSRKAWSLGGRGVERKRRTEALWTLFCSASVRHACGRHELLVPHLRSWWRSSRMQERRWPIRTRQLSLGPRGIISPTFTRLSRLSRRHLKILAAGTRSDLPPTLSVGMSTEEPESSHLPPSHDPKWQTLRSASQQCSRALSSILGSYPN